MNLTKLLAAGLVVLLAAGGVAATGTTLGAQPADDQATSVTNVEAQATYDNGTVTVTVTDAGEPLQNVTVYADGEKVGTTDANGTVTFDTNATEELELELVGDGFKGELEYLTQDGSLSLVEEEYEYERDDEAEDEEDEEEDEQDDEEAEEDEADEEDEDDDQEDDDEQEDEDEDDEEADDDDDGEADDD